jgi:hypothetical protein
MWLMLGDELIEDCVERIIFAARKTSLRERLSRLSNFKEGNVGFRPSDVSS